MIRFEIPEAPKVRADLHGLSMALQRKVYAAGGKAVEVRLRKFYREKNQEPNKNNWPKRNFYNREGAQKTALTDVKPGKATVQIASVPIAFKYQGGTISAKRGKYLTIPLTAEAYQKGSPREGGIQNLFFVKTHSGNKFLAQDDVGVLTLHYLLRETTTHEPDKSVLPTDEVMTTAARKAMNRAIGRAMRTGGREA